MNKDFFSTWSSNMAYMLGYFAADGCMSTRIRNGYITKRVEFTSVDFEHLEKVSKLLDLGKQPKCYKDGPKSAYTINASCPKMFDDLLLLGMTERKSLTLQFPKVPERYISDFVRGFFDGDGWISCCKTSTQAGFVSGSKDFLEKIQAELSKRDIPTTWNKAKKGNTYSLYVSNVEGLRKLFMFLYSTSNYETRLNRKYEKFKSIKRMGCYIIPPLTNLSLMHRGTNRYFCLAHFYLQDSKYREFFLKLDKTKVFITLDNSAAERSLVTETKLLDIVKELEPNEVISPDILFDKEKTINSLLSFIEKMKRLKVRTKIFGCPQGKTKEEWLECYKFMLARPEVSTIGLSKISVPFCWLGASKDEKIKEARQMCVQYLDENELLFKPIHLLGMGDPTEYRDYNHIMLRSTDSCYTILAATHGLEFGKNRFKRIETTNDFYTQKLLGPTKEIVAKNILFLRRQLGLK